MELRGAYLGRRQMLKGERLPDGECVADKSMQKRGSQDRQEVLSGGV